MVSRLEIHKRKKKNIFFKPLLIILFFSLTTSTVYIGYRLLNKSNTDEIEEVFDGKLSEGQLKIEINAYPTFKDGLSSGTLSIKNDIKNRYNIITEIYLTKDDSLVYKSSLLSPGKLIKTGKLQKNLSKGEYEAIAYFNAYTISSNQYVGRSAAKIKIIIKE
jgi:hypothetical protein